MAEVYITDLANDIFLELDEPTDCSIASIAANLRAKVGQLNLLTGKNFIINSALEISENGVLMDEQESEILKYTYLISYTTRQIKQALGAGAYEIIESVSSDGGTVKMVNRNLLSQNYIALRKEYSIELKNLVNKYKQKIAAVPRGISGDDYLTPNLTPPQPSIAYSRSLDDPVINNGGI